MYISNHTFSTKIYFNFCHKTTSLVKLLHFSPKTRLISTHGDVDLKNPFKKSVAAIVLHPVTMMTLL